MKILLSCLLAASAMLHGPVVPVSTQVPWQRRESDQATKDHHCRPQPSYRFVAQLGPQPPLDPVVAHHDKGKEEKKPTQEEPGWWEQAFGPTLFVNWILVLVGVGAGYLAWRTLLALREQVVLLARQISSSELNGQQQLRAYVAVEDVYLQDVDGIAHCHVSFKNTGQTPAVYVAGWVFANLQQFPLKEPYIHPDTPRSATYLAAGLSQSYTADTGYDFDRLQYVLQNDRSHAVFVQGLVTYKDIFGHRRETHCRFFIGGPSETSPSERNGTLIWKMHPDVEGNEAT